MEFVQVLIEYLKNELNFIVVLLVLVGGFGARVHLKRWNASPATKALVGGFGLVAAYVFLLVVAEELILSDAPRIFFSFCFTAFLYPFIKKPFNRVMCKITGANLHEVDEENDDDSKGTPDVLSTEPFFPKFRGTVKTDLA